MSGEQVNELSVKELAKAYKKKRVVESVSFSVQSGQVVGLLGPNGAGKTTSFYMVVGLVKCDRGQIYLNDLEISNFPMYKRARVGLSYLPQEPSIFRKLTVEENLQVALEAHNYSNSIRKEKSERLLEEFHITHIRSSYGYALSGGGAPSSGNCTRTGGVTEVYFIG